MTGHFSVETYIYLLIYIHNTYIYICCFLTYCSTYTGSPRSKECHHAATCSMIYLCIYIYIHKYLFKTTCPQMFLQFFFKRLPSNHLHLF